MQLDQAITEFFSGYFSTHDRSKKTEVAYKSDLQQLAAYAPKECSLSSLDAGLIEDWAADLRLKKYSPASMRRKMVVLKVFCSYWVRKGVLSESPFWRVKLSFGRIVQLPRSLTELEMRDLLAQARENHRTAEVLRKGSALAKLQDPAASARSYRALRNLALVDLLFATGIVLGKYQPSTWGILRSPSQFSELAGKEAEIDWLSSLTNRLSVFSEIT